MADLRIIRRVDPEATDRTRLRFGFVGGLGQVAGLEALLQLVVVHLLTSPGSDALHPERGGGLPGALMGLGSTADPARLAAAVQGAIAKTQREILSDQAAFSLPATERLAGIRLLRARAGTGDGVVDLQLRVTSEAGQSGQVAL